eukprot:1143460-Pelagomonas_calceolata.AAC.5
MESHDGSTMKERGTKEAHDDSTMKERGTKEAHDENTMKESGTKEARDDSTMKESGTKEAQENRELLPVARPLLREHPRLKDRATGTANDGESAQKPKFCVTPCLP